MPALAGSVLALGALALAATIAPLMGAAYLVSLLTKITIYALAASALNLVLGFGGMVSFGHAAYLGVGAYTAAILSFHAFEGAPLFGLFATNQAMLAWPLAAVLGGLGALLIGSISLRTSGVYFIMITLAFAQMLYFVFVSLEPYGGDDGLSLWWGRNDLPGFDLDNRQTLFWTSLLLLGLWQVALARLLASPFGRVLRAAKENELRLRSLGTNPYPHKLGAFALSGAICGLAGALAMNLNEFVSPSLMHWSRSGELMVMVILGGLGTLSGPLFGATALILLEEVLIGYTEHWQLILGVILLALVLGRGGGIVRLLPSAARHG